LKHDAFILFFPEAPKLEGPIRLRGYASRYARIDVYARTVLSLSDIRFEGEVYAAIPLENGYALLAARPAECMRAGEKQLVGYILRVLKNKESARCARYIDMHPERLLLLQSKERTIVRLAEDGADISRARIGERPVLWVMGAHKEPGPETERIIRDYAALRVSIGPLSYLASHTAVFIAWWRMRGNGV